jgi:hypothetical protein
VYGTQARVCVHLPRPRVNSGIPQPPVAVGGAMHPYRCRDRKAGACWRMGLEPSPTLIGGQWKVRPGRDDRSRRRRTAPTRRTFTWRAVGGVGPTPPAGRLPGGCGRGMGAHRGAIIAVYRVGRFSSSLMTIAFRLNHSSLRNCDAHRDRDGERERERERERGEGERERERGRERGREGWGPRGTGQPERLGGGRGTHQELVGDHLPRHDSGGSCAWKGPTWSGTPPSTLGPTETRPVAGGTGGRPAGTGAAPPAPQQPRGPVRRRRRRSWLRTLCYCYLK